MNKAHETLVKIAREFVGRTAGKRVRNYLAGLSVAGMKFPDGIACLLLDAGHLTLDQYGNYKLPVGTHEEESE